MKVVSAWLDDRDEQSAVLESLYLGRAIHYPWLSSLIVQSALAHPHWDVAAGKSLWVHENELVSELLSQIEIIEQLQVPFTPAGYVVTAVSVEKVLIDNISAVAPAHAPAHGLVPFDAQVWLHFRPYE